MREYNIVKQYLIDFYNQSYNKGIKDYVIYFTQKEDNNFWYHTETILAKIVKDKNGNIDVVFNKAFSNENICIDTIKIIPLWKVTDYYAEKILGL